MTGLEPHLQNMWLPRVTRVYHSSILILIKRGKWYAVPTYIIFDRSSELLSRTILTQLQIMPEIFFGYYASAVVSVFLHSFIPCRLLLDQCILFVIGQLCHAMETRFSPMLAIERTRRCGISESDHRANAVIFALGKRSTFINY